MKAECLKENIVSAIGLAERITGKNLPLAVLGYLYITTQKNTLLIRATNLDLGIEIAVPAKIATEGTVAVSGSVLQQFLNGVYESHSITLEDTDGVLTISSNTSTASVNTQPYEDFPTLPSVTDGVSISLPADSLIKGLKSVWYSASHTTIKPELSSVFIHSNDGKLVFAATDSFRLAEKQVSVRNVPDFDPILIPVKNIPDLIRVLEENSTEDIEIHITESQIALSCKRVYITSRLVNGTFPDYRQIIPKEYATEVVVLKQDILNALKTAHIFLDKFNQITFGIEPEQKTFTVHTQNTDVGENISTIDASLSGETLDIKFNHRYIYDCFQSIPTDSISFSFSGAGKPVVIRGVSDASFLYLVMPMNT